MQTNQNPEAQALWLEALSDKMLHQLPQAVWTQLFLGSDRDSIRFEERHLTLVHADTRAATDHPEAVERFSRELQRVNGRHHGRLDPYVNAAALVTFDDPGAAVRMAMELQRVAEHLDVRIGVVSGPCMMAFFRAQDRLWCTPLGAQPARAAEVAATASPGGIVISPETYAPLGLDAGAAAGPHGNDFEHSEPDLSSLAYVRSNIAVDIDIDALTAH
ncbi:MAG: adenylate cyclase-like protein [Ramlibacter sp.]|nr:adenylate cyclase-like protein [Ramlibacter sp.]